MTKNNKKTKTIPFKGGKEAVMLRIDKTLKKMMRDKPFSRFDVEYWHSKFTEIISDLKNSAYETKTLGAYFTDNDWLIPSDHVRASRGEQEGPNFPVEYYSPAGFFPTGYNIYNIPKCSKNAYQRMQRSRVKRDDILLGGFGMGPTGKSVFILHEPNEKSIVGNIFILRTKDKIDPTYLTVFLKSAFGQAQLTRYKAGVAFYSISSDEISSVLVPNLPPSIQSNIRKEYEEMYQLHDKAMEARKRGDGQSYKENLETAERMLKDLIAKTEAVIRGERNDVV